MKKITIKEIARIGIMSAAVYVASAFLQVPIPTARASAGRACGGDWLHVL